MALPLLPGEHIAPAFEKLADTQLVAGNTAIQTLLEYVKITWIDSRLWPTSSLSAYGSSVLTNNDVEGWHNRLNSRCRRGNLDVYQLAPILFKDKEASYVSLQASLVSEARLRRHQRKTYQRLQGRLAAVWSAYAAGQLSTSALLRKCARIYAVA